jgi:hypothetical protein
MSVGKHFGLSFSQVCERDPGYIAWALEVYPPPTGGLGRLVKYAKKLLRGGGGGGGKKKKKNKKRKHVGGGKWQ